MGCVTDSILYIQNTCQSIHCLIDCWRSTKWPVIFVTFKMPLRVCVFMCVCVYKRISKDYDFLLWLVSTLLTKAESYDEPGLCNLAGPASQFTSVIPLLYFLFWDYRGLPHLPEFHMLVGQALNPLTPLAHPNSFETIFISITTFAYVL